MALAVALFGIPGGHAHIPGSGFPFYLLVAPLAPPLALAALFTKDWPDGVVALLVFCAVYFSEPGWRHLKKRAQGRRP